MASSIILVEGRIELQVEATGRHSNVISTRSDLPNWASFCEDLKPPLITLVVYSLWIDVTFITIHST
jgi:hypothetical protein